MSKGGGGGYDTSGLEKSAEESIALQKEIYEQTRQDVQPWYNLGVGSVSRLADLLGISGGSQKSEQQIRSELLPSYTTKTQPSSDAYLFLNKNGDVVDLSGYDPVHMPHSGVYGFARDVYSGRMDIDEAAKLAEQGGYKRLGSPGGQSVVDTEGLNAEISRRLQEQKESGLPSDYGSLLRSFSLSDFEADPGYQFRQDEAKKALERNLSAQGVTLGGGGYGEINPMAMRYINQLTQDLASDEYNKSYQRYTADQLNKFNMLMGSAGMGQGSTGIMAGTGQSYAGNVGQIKTDLASAQMNAQLAKASQPSMFSQLLGTAAKVAPLFL